MLNGLDLFSGIGGLTIALEPWVRPVAYCENDRYATAVLLSRMQDGSLPLAPIWDDVRTLSGGMVPGPVDVVYGGFPCQDISRIGTGLGLRGKRSGLWSEYKRIICEVNPKLVFVENSDALNRNGLSAILKDFSDIGMDARWGCLSACAVGAPHTRNRMFILAHSKSLDGEIRLGTRETGKREIPEKRYREMRQNWMDTISRNAGSGAGVPNRVDRLKSLGNAVVPLQAREAFKRLMGL